MSTGRAGRLRWLRGRVTKAVRHSLFSAVVIACVLLILGHYGLTNWLDSIALRIAIAAKGPGTVSQIEADGSLGSRDRDVPAVVSITPELYESGFAQTSPLDRAVVAGLLDKLRQFNPAAVVIDLDLSPTGGRVDAKTDDLNRAIIDMVHAGIPVTMATPFPVATQDAFGQKYDWLASLCAAGVRFGYPDLLVSQGVVLRLDPSFPTIAVVAARAASGQLGGPTPVATALEPCQLAARGRESAAFLSSTFPTEQLVTAAGFASQVPINTDYLANRGSYGIQLVDISQTASLDRVKGRVVFLGGQFDPSDALQSAVGEVPGVWLHAAGYLTILRPPQRSLHTLAVVFDIAIGVASGLVFALGWARFNRHSIALAARTGNPVGHYLAAKGWLIVNFAALALVVATIFVVSAWLLQRNLWNNPAGMLIGTFIDAQMGSRTGIFVGANGGVDGRHDSGYDPRSIDWAKLMNRILLLPVIIWAAYILLQGHQ